MMGSSHPAGGTTKNGGQVYAILAGKLFDSRTRKLVENQVVIIDRELGVILDVIDLNKFQHQQAQQRGEDTELIDLGQWTLLPGFVDAHVHLFLHAYSETTWNDQVTKESLTERTIRATVHARDTLMAGFTTVRDLGTEGALDADIGLRKCLSGYKPIIPGPRYYCANRAIVTTGSYGPRSTLHPSNDGVEGVTGAQVADGVDGCIRAVRRQIGAGSDWIKIYGDYRVRAQMVDVSPSLSSKSIPTFNREELEVMITTAHNLGVKVAAHAFTGAAVKDLVDLGVDSIEHGAEIYLSEDQDISVIKQLAGAAERTKWVPTLAAFHTIGNKTGQGKTLWERAKETFVKAVIEEGLENVACGGDTAVFNHGENATELILMRQLGVPWEKILSWATLGGWECVRGSEWDGKVGQKRIQELEETPSKISDIDRGVPFGVIRRGWAADLIGVEGDLAGTAQDFESAVTKGVKLVIKNGKIVKWVEK